jgi:hypothetical protein
LDWYFFLLLNMVYVCAFFLAFHSHSIMGAFAISYKPLIRLGSLIASPHPPAAAMIAAAVLHGPFSVSTH